MIKEHFQEMEGDIAEFIELTMNGAFRNYETAVRPLIDAEFEEGTDMPDIQITNDVDLAYSTYDKLELSKQKCSKMLLEMVELMNRFRRKSLQGKILSQKRDGTGTPVLQFCTLSYQNKEGDLERDEYKELGTDLLEIMATYNIERVKLLLPDEYVKVAQTRLGVEEMERVTLH